MSRSYSFEEIADIKYQFHKLVDREIDEAIRLSTLDELIEKYGLYISEKEEMPFDDFTCKILVFGELAGKVKDYKIRAKKLGIDPERIEFVGYLDSKKINTTIYRNNLNYSDIIAGPMPHKLKGVGDNSSFLAEMKNYPNEYPRVIEARDNSNKNSLKLSITAFESCLKKTKYYRDVVGQGY